MESAEESDLFEAVANIRKTPQQVGLELCNTGSKIDLDKMNGALELDRSLESLGSWDSEYRLGKCIPASGHLWVWSSGCSPSPHPSSFARHPRLRSRKPAQRKLRTSENTNQFNDPSSSIQERRGTPSISNLVNGVFALRNRRS